jgi:peptidoglycan hydrolase-like protein with peptidoglycan-binding domain
MLLKLNSKSSTVATIQEWLNFLGYRYKAAGGTFKTLKVTGIFDEATESVVTNFQSSEAIYADGIVGPVTMKKLEKAYAARILELNSPGIDFTDAKIDRFTLERIHADTYEQGYTSLMLRSDAAGAYNNVRADVISQGGILTSSGTMRSLTAQVTQSRSAVSFHYLGLALDLYIYSGMTNIDKDPYVVVLENDRYHRVYARCAEDWSFNKKDKPADITLPPVKELKNIVTYKERNPANNPSINGRFIDLTKIFETNGFKRIRARKNFYDGDSMMGAEWWHFQYEKGLMPHVSTFGNELLKIYSEDTVKNTPPWEQRHRVFQDNWF